MAAPAPKAEETLSFREYVDRVRPGYQWYKHCEVLGDVAQRIADGELKRVMIFMPPRHGKSEEISRLFTSYYLYRFPDRWVAVNSYSADLAYTLSRAAKENYTRAGGSIQGDAKAVKHWQTGQGGGMWATGVGGPATGKGFHLGVIDDPLKNAEQAASEVIREKQKEWYSSTFYTREEPGGAQVVIQTRWNEDDLAGWLLKQESDEDGEPEGWHVVSFEAIKDLEPVAVPPSCTLEPDWREPGEPLCPERYPIEKLKKLAKRIGEYFWNALFQQRPQPREGGMFKRAWFRTVHFLPKFRFEGEKEVAVKYSYLRYWDKAGTQDGGCYTCGVLLAKADDGRIFVVDVVRGQWSAGERERTILATATADRLNYGRVTIWLEEEGGSGGKESAQNSLKNLAGFSAHADRVTDPKGVRAEPWATALESLNVWLLAAAWNEKFITEHLGFPRAALKDQVDASAGAYNKITTKREWRVG